MLWNNLFAERISGLHRSSVREFLKLAAEPGMISFAGGLPAPELFPIEEVRAASEKVLTRFGGKALQYGETEGLRELREWLAAKHGVCMENILITSSAQQALDLVGRVLLDPGDKVALENPTYLSLLSAWRPLGVEYVTVPDDAAGLIVSGIPAGCKLLYTIPNFQNPRGTTLGRERRVALSQKAIREQLILVEDDPYGDLRYEGEPLPSLFSLAEGPRGPVIYVGSFSKILAPGFRVGWIVADAAVIERLVLAKQPMDLQTSTWNQYLVHELVARGFLPAHVRRLCAAYRIRRDAMLEALARWMPDGVEWTRPAGGMFLFATLPPTMDATDLVNAAVREKVLVVPGADFHVSGGRNSFRLNFSNASPETIREGIGRLGKVVNSLFADPELVSIR